MKLAIKNMNPTKALGPDGMHAIFYQQYWDIVGNDVVDLCLKVLNDQKDPGDLNDTFISLILKSKNPTRMCDFRPISLCNVVYKTMAKVLENRLKIVLKDIVHPAQFAFVPGCLISDNALILFECFHAINIRRKCNVG